MAAKKKTAVAKSMSAAHKAALQVGRDESRAVRQYLEALEAHRPKRGRPRTVVSISRRIEAIDAAMEDADPLTRLQFIQEHIDLEAEIASLQAVWSLAEVEAAFIDAAAGYSNRKGISYAAWRAVGVDAAVLKAAGIRRGAS